MSGKIVICVAESRAILTKETKGANGTTAVAADLDGNPIPSDGVTYAGLNPALVTTFVDAITGKRFARVSIAKAGELIKAGTDVYQGVGSVGGWFVPAPDPSGAPAAPATEHKPGEQKPGEQRTKAA